MTEPETFTEWAANNTDPIEVRIESLWESLSAALVTERITDAQFAYVMDREAEWGSDGPTSRWVFSHYLGACVLDPESIGHDDDQTYPCGQCLDGDGWLAEDERCPRCREYHVYPCPSCNEKAYDLFMGGHYRPNHVCNDCAPTRTKRGKAGASARDEVVTERRSRADLDQRELEDDLI